MKAQVIYRLFWILPFLILISCAQSAAIPNIHTISPNLLLLSSDDVIFTANECDSKTQCLDTEYEAFNSYGRKGDITLAFRQQVIRSSLHSASMALYREYTNATLRETAPVAQTYDVRTIESYISVRAQQSKVVCELDDGDNVCEAFFVYDNYFVRLYLPLFDRGSGLTETEIATVIQRLEAHVSATLDT